MKLRSIPDFRAGSRAALLAVLIATPAIPHEPPREGCGVLSADLAHELAVMRSTAISVNADANTAVHPRLELDRRYAITLIEQKQLRLRAKPGRAARSAASRGGAFEFEAPASGRYRVSITSRHWIDIVDGDSTVPSVDHHGPGCDLMHKVVEFDLAGERTFTLQLSGQDDAIIGLAITAVPTSSKPAPT